MLQAIEAPLYDIGVLSDRGMLPGLDGIPASVVLAKLAMLKHRNARGSHIYIRPSGEHRYTALDDLSEVSLAQLAADGFTPCAVVETSAGNFQAWLKHPTVFPKLLGTLAAQTLAARYNADPQVRAGFARRSAQGEFRTVAHSPGAAGERYTTAAMLRMEREAIQRMQEGNRVALGNEP